jgi:hypothetical protein
MTKSTHFKARVAVVLLLHVVLIMLGWWLAGQQDSAGPRAAITSPSENAQWGRGPYDPSFCGPPAKPHPAPPMDSPFGVHLFSTTALGVIRPVPGVLAIADDLGLPVAITEKSAIKPKNEGAYEDVQSVGILLEEFRRAFGAMPTGELNDEIVRRLQGGNPKGIAVLPKTHPAINAQGELIDRWGTPYRFHPESSWETTIRSAGPDKKMWSSDDILSESSSTDLVQK